MRTTMLERALQTIVAADLQRKMVFLSGPRQSGKTTLAESLLQLEHGKSWEPHYLNWDDDDHRTRILKREFPSAGGLIVFDELHKFSRWRNYLKGLYDTQKRRRKILVTGSGRLDYYRRGGDSLQGRYHHLRLYPFSFKEVSASIDDLLRLGPFPEPLTDGTERFARRWSREYRTRLIREDLAALERVIELGTLEQLMIRLPDLVGSPLSVNALREDLQVAHQTVVRWLDMLERMFAFFRVLPFGHPRIKAVKKETKHYLYDWTTVPEPGARFENLIGFHLLKHCHYVEDVEGIDCELRFARDIEGREVDFIVTANRKASVAVECKLSDRRASPELRYLKARVPGLEAVQVIAAKGIDFRDGDGVRICSAEAFLSELAI
ncbi:MAG: ATP-binding protein [Planctomycetes bacterium]|nr:ATP-binding protein [Planctomycetota bacterium]